MSGPGTTQAVRAVRVAWTAWRLAGDCHKQLVSWSVCARGEA